MGGFSERRDIEVLVSAIAAVVRNDVYTAFNVASGKGYTMVKAPITADVIRRHVKNEQPIAVYPVMGDMSRVGVLDIDNHGDELTWERVVEKAAPLITDLVAMGFQPMVFRSGGGNGLHVWLVWNAPQPARSIRRLLRELLARHGLRAGTEGIAEGAVEVYPKQDSVPAENYGSAIALPFARRSMPLDHLVATITATEYVPPELEKVCAPDVGDDDVQGAGLVMPPKANATVTSTLNIVLDGDVEEAAAALDTIPAIDYGLWVRIGLILKYSFGEDGFPLWVSWSAKAPAKFPGEAACRKHWDGLRPTGAVGLGSLFHEAQQHKWNGPTDPVVREMNARFGILTHGNKTQIIVKNGDRRPTDKFVTLTKQTFEDRIASETVASPGGGAPMPKAKYWMRHARADHYHRLIFDPSKKPGSNSKEWNLWQGFGVKPIPGSWEGLKAHMRDNICGGRQDLFDWLLNWMALGVQQPALVIGTAPVLMGLPGTGKGVLAHSYGRLWGVHYTTVTHESHVSGRFNAHFFAKRFVFIDEGIFGGDHSKAGIIKTRITEPSIMVEMKGIDPFEMENRMITMVASNSASAVPADKADRRWQVLAVGDAHREDHDYFGSIAEEMVNGGYEAMLHELLHHEWQKGPDPRRTIKTEALFEQIIRVEGPELRYLYQVLSDGVLPQCHVRGNASNATTIRALWEDMRRSQAGAHYVQRQVFGRLLQKVIPGIDTTQSGSFQLKPESTHNPGEYERSTRYRFPPLPDCRAAFESHIGQPVPWPNDEGEWQCLEDPI